MLTLVYRIVLSDHLFMGSHPITFLWLWPATDHEPHCRHVPINRTWKRTESTPPSGWWRSHMAGIDCSTREINNVTLLIADWFLTNCFVLRLCSKQVIESLPYQTWFHCCVKSLHKAIWYDTTWDAILTCTRKPTWVSLIYSTEPTTRKCKTEKLKSKNGHAQK